MKIWFAPPVVIPIACVIVVAITRFAIDRMRRVSPTAAAGPARVFQERADERRALDAAISEGWPASPPRGRRDASDERAQASIHRPTRQLVPSF